MVKWLKTRPANSEHVKTLENSYKNIVLPVKCH